jgi:dienelactone hydrolase
MTSRGTSMERVAIQAVLWSLLSASRFVSTPGMAEQHETLPGTEPLTLTGDMSVKMREGLDRFLSRELDQSVEARQKLWKRDFSSPEAYVKSIEPNRQDFRRFIGLTDTRLPVRALEYEAGTDSPSLVAENSNLRVFAVRWQVLEEVYGEGLLLQPRSKVWARVVAIPDADQTPEMIAGLTEGVEPERQFARRLAEAGCQVLAPVLINRQDTWSGDPEIVMTNEPHREWIYRQSFALGRHIIGYEVQKVVGAVDWFRNAESGDGKIGVAGYGEGGLIAFYAGAVDPRIDAVLVSGYFDSRQRIYEEPLYRNVFGLLREFGDAEIAGLIAPRKFIVEYSAGPETSRPSKAPARGRNAAAPGKLGTPAFESVRGEVDRARGLVPHNEAIELVLGSLGKTVGPGSNRALAALLRDLGVKERLGIPSKRTLSDRRKTFNPDQRQHRQILELVAYNQKLAHESAGVREAFWKDAKSDSVARWEASTQKYREYYWQEVIGRLPRPSLPINPRTRKKFETPKWAAYEVVLDVWPDVSDWGYLLLPKGMKPGERRPVVVCQHGLESLPEDVFDASPGTMAFGLYHNYGASLADQGFVVYAPHNFYRGDNNFRQLQRKANPLKLTLWSITVGQHEQMLNWLDSLPFVDPSRIAFYGLSYGGATAMYVPPVVRRYAVVICSGNFTELIRKTVTVDNPYSLVFYQTYEAEEFNIANTFGYAELAGLIAPRPFMVERGHLDTVSPDEWVALEYSRVRRLYDFLGIPGRTSIEVFNGPHAIHGVGTFEFLHRFLHWPDQSFAPDAHTDHPFGLRDQHLERPAWRRDSTRFPAGGS